MWFAYPALVAGTAVLALLGLALGLRVRAVPATTLVGSAAAVALFTAHALVVVAVGRGGGTATLDRAVLDWFLAHRGDAATAVMRAASFAGDSPATAVAVAVAVVLLWWRGRRAGAAALAVAALGSPLLSSGFKRLYGRERPPVADHLTAAGGYALPSGHALNSIVVIGVLVAACALHVRRTGSRVALVSAGAVAVAAVGGSRLYLGVHWLTDVLAGWFLGGAWVAVCVTAMVALDRRDTTRRDHRKNSSGIASEQSYN
jgi:membrane-associated phospholipid phosphatase